MENYNSQQPSHGQESMINPATHSHQDINHATPHNQTPVEGQERDQARREASGHLEAEVTGAVGVTSSSRGGREPQQERVSPPQNAGQVQKDASTKHASPMFKPLPDSVLHSALQSPPKKHAQEPLFRPSPPSDEEDNVPASDDVISLHSTDSEAPGDNEDAIAVEDMVSPYESLFTPPPATNDDDTPVAYIQSAPSKSKKPTRCVMTHVEVPPLRRPKSDYKDAKDIIPLKARPKARRKQSQQGQAHSSLLAALQAQMAHNSGIHDDEDMIVEKPPPKKKKKPQPLQQNAVAGPSRLPPFSNSLRTKVKPKRRLIESSSSSGDEVVVSSSSRAGLASKGKDIEAARKRQKVTIDLTTDVDDGDDEGTPAVKTACYSPPRTGSTAPQPVCQTPPNLGPRSSPINQNANHSSPISSPASSVSFRRPSLIMFGDGAQDPEGHQRLNLRIYPHPPPPIVHVNTRFHRQRLQDTTHADAVISSSLPTTGNSEQNGISGVSASRRFPWGGLMGGHSPRNDRALRDDMDLISLGYTPLGPYNDDADFESDDPDADVPTLKLERQPSMSPFVERAVAPVKIDLAAEFKKRKLAKGKQRQTQPNQIFFPSGSNKDQEGPDGDDILVTSEDSISLNPFSQHSDHLQTYLMSPLPVSSAALRIGFQALPPSTDAPPYAIRRPTGDLGVFMHDYSARPPSPDIHSQIASGSASSLASFSTAVGVGVGAAPYPDAYSLTLQQGPLGLHTGTATSPAFYQSDTIFLTAGQVGTSPRLEAGARFPSSAVFDGGLAALGEESWMTTDQPRAADYGYDTVDPTLICGGFANYDDGAVLSASAGELESGKNAATGDIGGAAGGECASSDDDREEAGIASMLSNVSKAGSLFSGRSGASSVRCPSASAESSSSSSPTSSVAPLPTSLTSLDGSPSSQASGFSPSKPTRLETPASFDPKSTLSGVKETLNAVSEERSRVFITRYGSSPLSDLTSISDGSSIVTPVAAQPNPIAGVKTSKAAVDVAHKPRAPAPGWEEHVPDDQIYCHQCRCRNSRPKMRCACKAKYCSRCIDARLRYVQVLQPGGRVYSCPRCEQWCTCTSCCKKRGEIYIPASAESTVPPSIAATPALSPRLPPTALPQSPLPDHLGHLFCSSSSRPRSAPLHTVEGLRSFRTASHLSSSLDAGPGSQPAPEPLASTSKKKSRVFIGKAQPSWGLGKKPRTRELDPAPLAEWPDNPTGPCTVRYYIGSTNFLQHKQMRLENTDDLLAGVTSVASLADSDPENVDDAASSTCHEEGPLVDDDKYEPPSPALCQQDVARAISATYESFGHTVILSEEFRQ